MMNYRVVLFSGILGLAAGQGWAGDFCAEHGQMAAAIARARAAGVPKATAMQVLITPNVPTSVQALLQSTLDWVYVSPQSPEELARRAEAVCRRVIPAPAHP